MAEFWLDQLSGERAGVVDHFEREVVSMGRNDDCDLLYDAAGVSWDHAEIRRRDGEWWLIDTGSTNGTYVNEERAHNARLNKGDVIRMGKRGPRMRFLLEAPKTSESSGDRPKSPPPRPEKRRPRKPSEPEIAIPDLSDGPGRGHSDLEPAPLPTSRPSPVPLVILAGLSVVLVFLLGVLYVEYDAQSTDLSDARARAAEARKGLSEAQAAQAEAIAANEAEVRRELGVELNESKAKVRRLQADLRVLKSTREEQDRQLKSLSRDLARLRRERASGGGKGKSWASIERNLSRSVVMIACRLEGTNKEGKRVRLDGFGTGFFASSQGHIVTNKHVVEPWKFRDMALRIAREGIEIDPKSYHLYAWRSGTRFVRKKSGGKGYELDPSTGYSTIEKSLEMVRTAPDQWHIVTGGDAARQVQVHVMHGNGDLAILRARAARVVPIPIGRSRDTKKWHKVMVLGYPGGPALLSSGVAETSPTTGEITLANDQNGPLRVSAPIVPGNSGGPLIDEKGRVIGVCTRTLKNAETHGTCLRIEYAMRLIHGGSW